MKKVTKVENKKAAYNISVIINDTALIYSVESKSTLYDIKKHEILGEFRDYFTHYYVDNKFFILEIRDINEKNRITIYDALEKKYLVEDYIYVSGNSDFMTLKNPVTNKYHLFDLSVVRTEKNIFYNEYESISFLLDMFYAHFYVLEKDGKKAIYEKEKGFFTDFIYDNIEILEKEIFIVTRNGKKSFVYYIYDEGFIKSPEFDEIFKDEKKENLLYCKNSNGINIYVLDSCKNNLICIFSHIDTIKCTKDSGDVKIFIVGKNNKYGIYKYSKKAKNNYALESLTSDNVKHGFKNNKLYYEEYNLDNYTEVVKIKYDKIEEEYGNYFLYEDMSGNNMRNIGYYTYIRNHDYFKEAEFDDINVFTAIILFFKKGYCDIYTYDDFNNPIISKCRYINNYSDNIIFEKYNQMCLFIPGNPKENNILLKGYDNITYRTNYLSKNLYITNRGGKKGIIYRGEVIFEANNKNISIYCVNESKHSSAESIYIVLINEKNQIHKICKKDNSIFPEAEIKEIDAEYIRTEFFTDFYLLDNGSEVKIFNYKDKYLNSFPTGTKIRKLISDNKNSNVLYYIEDEVYFYKNGILEKAIIEEYSIYETSFEFEEYIYSIISYNQQVHDMFCDYIESITDEEALKNLENYINKNYKLNYDYPNLKLTKKEKNNE